MPRSFNGTTFIAFIDISGFKELMKNENEAGKALQKLYNTDYKIINRQDPIEIQGLFVSDCAVLFIEYPGGGNDINSLGGIYGLNALLNTIKEINKIMLDNNIMLTTSIAFGRLVYKDLRESERLSKNYIIGEGYLKAFFDNEKEKPKIQPGQCRIVDINIPQKIKNKIKEPSDSSFDNVFRLIRKRNRDNNHYYFYWMVDDPNNIISFEKKYIKANKLTRTKKYYEIMKLLRTEVLNSSRINF